MKRPSRDVFKNFLISALAAGLFLSCQSTGNKNSDKKDMVVEDILKQHATRPKDVIDGLKTCEVSCKSPDNEIAKDLREGYEILFVASAEQGATGTLTSAQQSRAIQGQAKIRQAFFKILAMKDSRDILEIAYRELAGPPSVYGVVDPDVQKAIDATIERLKGKPATLATSWYLRAISIPQGTENVLDVIAAYKKCIEIDRNDGGCQGGYSDLAKFYERPRCLDPNFNHFIEFHSAKPEATKDFKKKIIIGDKSLFEKSGPVLTAKDLLEATLENLGPERWEIWMTLKTFSVGKLTKFTENTDKSRIFLLMQSKDEILSGAPVNQKITDGQFRMPFANLGLAKEAFDKICAKATPDQLPQGLR